MTDNLIYIYIFNNYEINLSEGNVLKQRERDKGENMRV